MPQNRGGAITPRQKKAILALFSDRAKSMQDVADSVSVNRRTLYRWINEDEDFQAALAEAESREIDKISRRLIRLEKKAMDAFEKILDKPDSPGVWAMLRTAQAITDNLLRVRELRNVEARLVEIERWLYGEKFQDE
jgi:AcrR family transcriptional regulator